MPPTEQFLAEIAAIEEEADKRHPNEIMHLQITVIMADYLRRIDCCQDCIDKVYDSGLTL